MRGGVCGRRSRVGMRAYLWRTQVKMHNTKTRAPQGTHSHCTVTLVRVSSLHAAHHRASKSLGGKNGAAVHTSQSRVTASG